MCTSWIKNIMQKTFLWNGKLIRSCKGSFFNMITKIAKSMFVQW